MIKFLIDVNLPYYFSLWNTSEFIHVKDINDEWPDSMIWDYAKENNLIILTKDSDFSNRIILSEPPPKIIHIKFGNMKMKEFYIHLSSNWPVIMDLIESCKLVNVFIDRIEGIR